MEGKVKCSDANTDCGKCRHLDDHYPLYCHDGRVSDGLICTDEGECKNGNKKSIVKCLVRGEEMIHKYSVQTECPTTTAMVRDLDGGYVLYKDHLRELNHAIMLKDQEIARLTNLVAEGLLHIGNLRKANEGMSAACAKSDEHIDKIEAENARLRVESVDLHDKYGKLWDAMKTIEADTSSRPGRELWEYYCNRLYKILLIARAALEANP